MIGGRLHPPSRKRARISGSRLGVREKHCKGTFQVDASTVFPCRLPVCMRTRIAQFGGGISQRYGPTRTLIGRGRASGK